MLLDVVFDLIDCREVGCEEEGRDEGGEVFANGENQIDLYLFIGTYTKFDSLPGLKKFNTIFTKSNPSLIITLVFCFWSPLFLTNHS